MSTAPPARAEAELDELSADECQLLLSRGLIGRIAFVANGLPMVLPVNYRLFSDELGLWVVLRTRPGHLIDSAPEKVAFEIDAVDHGNRQGWSVVVGGVLHRLDRNEIELFSKRFDPKPWPQQERTSWLAVKVQTITGRRLRSADDTWPFPSEAYL